MPSTYSGLLRVELIGAGEQVGTWNLTTNRNLGTILEEAIAGVESIDITAGDITLQALNGFTDQARKAAIVFTGTPAADVTVTVPVSSKLYVIRNNTTKVVKISNAFGNYSVPPAAIATVVVQGSGPIIGYGLTDSITQLLTRNNIAELDSPTFTGTPTVPTAAPGTSTKQIASTEYVLKNGVPVGGIILFHGAVVDIPSGWFLCDGTNGTPDLRGTFIIGAGGAYNPGATGGSADAVVVSHSHSGATGVASADHSHFGTTNTVPDHVHNGIARYRSGGNTMFAEGGGGWFSNDANSQPAGSHAHSFTTGGMSANHTHSISVDGVNGTGKNMPPYYALCYIMRG